MNLNINTLTEDDIKTIKGYISAIIHSKNYHKIPVDDVLSLVMENLVRWPYDPSKGAIEKTYLYLITMSSLNWLYKFGKYKNTTSINDIEGFDYHRNTTELEYKPETIIDYINTYSDKYPMLHKMIESGFNATYDDLVIYFNVPLSTVKNNIHNERRRLKRRFNYSEMFM